MPTGALAHIAYWEGSGDVPVVVPPVTRPGYPGWQAGVVCASLLGGLQAWYERWRELYRIARLMASWAPRGRLFIEQYGEQFAACTAEQRAVLVTTLATMQSPDFTLAKAAVRTTATTSGFNKPVAWTRLSHQLHVRYDWAENCWRHLDAMRQLDDAKTTTMTNPQKNLMVELAYQAYAINPRGGLKD